MKEKPRAYLDTSVISAYFDARTPDRMEITQKFWAINRELYDFEISEVTVAEIQKTPSKQRRDEMESLIASLPVQILTKAAHELAQVFQTNNLVPPKKDEDALHLAVAVERGYDVLVSWNFRHMVNVKTQLLLPSLSAQRGYFKKLLILSPVQFQEDESNELA